MRSKIQPFRHLYSFQIPSFRRISAAPAASFCFLLLCPFTSIGKHRSKIRSYILCSWMLSVAFICSPVRLVVTIIGFPDRYLQSTMLYTISCMYSVLRSAPRSIQTRSEYRLRLSSTFCFSENDPCIWFTIRSKIRH